MRRDRRRPSLEARSMRPRSVSPRDRSDSVPSRARSPPAGPSVRSSSASAGDGVHARVRSRLISQKLFSRSTSNRARAPAQSPGDSASRALSFSRARGSAAMPSSAARPILRLRALELRGSSRSPARASTRLALLHLRAQRELRALDDPGARRRRTSSSGRLASASRSAPLRADVLDLRVTLGDVRARRPARAQAAPSPAAGDSGRCSTTRARWSSPGGADAGVARGAENRAGSRSRGEPGGADGGGATATMSLRAVPAVPRCAPRKPRVGVEGDDVKRNSTSISMVSRGFCFFFLGDAPRARRAGATYRTSSTMVRKRAVDRERRTTE